MGHRTVRVRGNFDADTASGQRPLPAGFPPSCGSLPRPANRATAGRPPPGPVGGLLPPKPPTGLVLDRARTGCGSNPAARAGGSWGHGGSDGPRPRQLRHRHGFRATAATGRVPAELRQPPPARNQCRRRTAPTWPGRRSAPPETADRAGPRPRAHGLREQPGGPRGRFVGPWGIGRSESEATSTPTRLPGNGRYRPGSRRAAAASPGAQPVPPPDGSHLARSAVCSPRNRRPGWSSTARARAAGVTRRSAREVHGAMGHRTSRGLGSSEKTLERMSA
ncbi:hypothetical protein HMPREF1211_05025 [Streptomyces sp. HGB0020]|nr:hypothetical protein HMPREF1211_05025 [Streptomyces sp. HGB0020]